MDHQTKCERMYALDQVAKALLDSGRLSVDLPKGLVYATESRTPTKPIGTANRRGYLRTCITTRGKAVCLMVHRIVWIAANGVPPLGHQINHKNGEKANNAIANLELATPAQNNEHARRTGLWKPNYGLLNGQSKLSEVEKATIRALKNCGAATKELAEKYGVSETHIRRIAKVA